jgi:hypothetical protein
VYIYVVLFSFLHGKVNKNGSLCDREFFFFCSVSYFIVHEEHLMVEDRNL